MGLDPPLSNTRHTHAQTRNHTAPSLFCWDGNRLLAEQKGDTHQLYLYEPDSFVPLAIVRWKAANAGDAGTGDGAGTANNDAAHTSRTGAKDGPRSIAQGTTNATDTDRSPLLPPELLSLKDRYPEQWAKLEAQRRKLARQLGQSPEPEAPTPPKPEVFHVHVDHLGTPREITDTDGHLVWTANYAAWGKAITANPPRRILTRQGNTVAEVIEEQAEPLECNLRFQGQYADAESGLHYNRFRYYEPQLGRFGNQDPIGLAGGTNSYRYAPNPVYWIDPLGLDADALAANLGSANRPLLPEQTPHHIVQENCGKNRHVQNSRAILARNGVDIDSAANGARLWGTHPNQVAGPNHPGRAAARAAGNYHAGPHIHSNANDKLIYQILKNAEKRGIGIESILEDIGRRMESGRRSLAFAACCCP